jgi:hypothetical protein
VSLWGVYRLELCALEKMELTAVVAGLRESPKKIITYTWLGTLVYFRSPSSHSFDDLLPVHSWDNLYRDVHRWLMSVLHLTCLTSFSPTFVQI